MREKTMRLDVLAVVILIIAIGGCAAPSNKTVSEDAAAGVSGEMAEDGDFDLLEEEIAEQAVEVSDPLESVNRLMYGVNDAFYFWVAKPGVELYTGITNKPIRIGVRNFFHNLSTPIRFVNCHLQGKTAEADVELGRFLINSTFGILGIGDPAKKDHGMEIPKKEDLGQTLAVHGVGNGFYLV
ncbi:MAG: VacJ family lipoprotein, partial [Planctomycetes bacterium]|nr:VacJ family lipoprotein [Planctomycetota bacterium]